jgi:hypothetical protein
MATGKFARGNVSSEGSKDDARRASGVIAQESPDQGAATEDNQPASGPANPADLSDNVFLADPIEPTEPVETYVHDLEFKPEAQEAEKVLPSDGLYGNNTPESPFLGNPFGSLEEEALETPNKGLEGTLEAISPLEGAGDTIEPSIPSENPLELPSGLLEDTPEPPSETPKEAKKRLKAEAKQSKRDKKKGKSPDPQIESQPKPADDSRLPSYVVQSAVDEESNSPSSGNMFLDSVVKEDGIEDIIPSFAPPTRNTVAETAVEGGRTIGRTAINLVIGLCVGALVVGYFMITMGPYTLTQFGLIRNDIPVPVNAIPEGYEVIASRWGTTPTEGVAALADPFTLDATKVRIDERVVLDDGNVAYNVTCLDGSCPKGLTNTIPFQSIIGI